MHKWGRQMPNKDSDMYPKPEYDLQGWDIDVMECGNTHTFISAGGGEEQSAIAYGSGTGHGELGFGDGDAKSSAKPKKVDSLEGVKVAAVGCGQAHTVVLVDGSDEYVTALPAFTPVADLDFSESSSNNSSSSGSGGKGKKKAGSQGGSGGKKAKKK